MSGNRKALAGSTRRSPGWRPRPGRQNALGDPWREPIGSLGLVRRDALALKMHFRPPSGAYSWEAWERTLGRTPEIADLSLFAASALTEVSQFYWPRGVFSGRELIPGLVHCA